MTILRILYLYKNKR